MKVTRCTHRLMLATICACLLWLFTWDGSHARVRLPVLLSGSEVFVKRVVRIGSHGSMRSQKKPEVLNGDDLSKNDEKTPAVDGIDGMNSNSYDAYNYEKDDEEGYTSNEVDSANTNDTSQFENDGDKPDMNEDTDASLNMTYSITSKALENGTSSQAHTKVPTLVPQDNSSGLNSNGKEDRLVIFSLYHKTGNVMFTKAMSVAFKRSHFTACDDNGRGLLLAPRYFHRMVDNGCKVVGVNNLPLHEFNIHDAAQFLPKFQHVRVMHLVRPVQHLVLSYYIYHIIKGAEENFEKAKSPCSAPRAEPLLFLDVPQTTIDDLVKHCTSIWEKYSELIPSDAKSVNLHEMGSFITSQGNQEDAVLLMFYHALLGKPFVGSKTGMLRFVHRNPAELASMVANAKIFRNNTMPDRVEIMTATTGSFSSEESVRKYGNFIFGDPAKADFFTSTFMEIQKTRLHEWEGHQSKTYLGPERRMELEKLLLEHELVGPVIQSFNKILGF